MLRYDEIPLLRPNKIGQDEEKPGKRIDYDYIFRDLLETRNPPITIERYEARRAAKIEEYRQRREQRRRRAEGAMELE